MMQAGYEAAAAMPYMKLKKGLVAAGVPKKEISHCIGVPSLIRFMRENGIVWEN
jgi:hypothetical protein